MNSEKKVLIAIFLVALLVRILFLLIFPLAAPDASEYDRCALSILQGTGFPAGLINRAPLYPLFLSFIYLVFGHTFLVVRIIQSILGAIICVFVYFIGKRVFKQERVAILGASAAVICPSLIASNSYILTETLTTFLLIGAIILLMRGLETKRKRIWGLSGIVLGLATLARPVILFFPLFLLLGLLLFFKKRLQNFIFVIIFSLGMAVVILPWTVRNYLAFRQFIPITTSGGFNLWAGSYLPWNGDYNYRDLSAAENLVKGLSPEEANKKFFQEGVKNIKENPGAYLILSIKKLRRFWLRIPGGEMVLEGKDKEKILIFTFHYILFFFFLLGLYLCLKEKRKELFIPLSIILYFTLIHILLLALPRYRIPVMPLVLAIAGGGIERIIKNSKRRSRCEARSTVTIS